MALRLLPSSAPPPFLAILPNHAYANRPMNAKPLPLEGKIGLVFGVANKRSIAWAIAQAWAEAGAKLVFNYQGERLKENVEELGGTFGPETPILPCDVTKDEEVD